MGGDELVDEDVAVDDPHPLRDDPVRVCGGGGRAGGGGMVRGGTRASVRPSQSVWWEGVGLDHGA